jgi:hypothetical protein
VRVLILFSAALLLFACSTQRDVNGIAAVHRYVAAKKHWDSRSYRVEAGHREGKLVAYDVVFLADDTSRAPGGGESFEAFYDPASDKIVKVLYGQ